MIHYFDYASTTFRKPKVVYKAVKAYKKYGVNLSRGNNQNKCKEIVSKTRDNIRKIVGADDNYEVAFCQSATYMINQVLKGLDHSKIKTIYISQFEHNSVYRVVNRIKEEYGTTIQNLATKNYELDIDKIKEQFKEQKPDLVIICHVSNVCGVIQKYEEVFACAKMYGSLTLLDSAQSCGLLDINMCKHKVDITIFAGHKTLYGFTGIGGAVIRKGLKIKDLIQGGVGFDSANEKMPDNLPYKLEPGTQNILGIFSLYYSTNYILGLGKTRILQIEQNNYIKLKEIIKKSTVLNIIDIKNSIGIIACVPQKHYPDNYEEFFNKRNISVRIGLQCSPLAHKTLGTFPAGTIRFSVGLLTKKKDLKVLEKAIKQLNKEFDSRV